MEKLTVQEIMKIFIDIIQDNGKMIKEMVQDKNNLKINPKNILVILFKINIMEKVNLQHNNSHIKANLKMDFSKVMAKSNIIMEKSFKALSKKDKNILEDILILIVASMMVCLKIVSLMELVNSFGLMVCFIEDNGNLVFNKELEFKSIKMENK